MSSVGLHLTMDAYFVLSRFSLTAIGFQQILHLTLAFVGMHSTAASIWVVTSFHICQSGYVFHMSPEEYQILFLLYRGKGTIHGETGLIIY